MPPWPPDRELRIDQSANPIVWCTHPRTTEDLPEVTDADIDTMFGDFGATSRRIITYGHVVPKDKHSAHFLATRRGLKMHTDPGYVRFTHHLVLRNDGLGITGLSATVRYPTFERGALYCLDSWSPHCVDWDDRLPRTGLYKVQAAIDADYPMSVEEVLDELAPLLARGTVTGDPLLAVHKR